MNSEELKSLIVLNLAGERRWVVDCLERGMKPSEILGQMKELALFPQSFNPEKEMEQCHSRGIRLVTWFDEDYPKLLRQIYDPPIVLYVKGALTQNDAAAVAVVGTRHPSLYGMDQARLFSKELAEKGLTVVSGFAKGIDQVAHQAALSVSYGRTLAILGCGLDIDYPSGSRALFAQVSERGAMISELPLGTSPRVENFPRRNRIISGLSRGVLVVEAALRSGSLITARLAMEEGREVFAIPGQLDRVTSRGTNHLIKEGAALVETADDIIQAMGPQLLADETALSFRREFLQKPQTFESDRGPTPAPSLPFNNDEQQLLTALQQEPLSREEITNRSALAPHRANSLLTQLELQQRIRRHHDGRFALASTPAAG